MTLFHKFRISIPIRSRRMEKLETLSLGPVQSLHLVRVDGQEYLVLLGGGNASMLPAPQTPREIVP